MEHAIFIILFIINMLRIIFIMGESDLSKVVTNQSVFVIFCFYRITSYRETE